MTALRETLVASIAAEEGRGAAASLRASADAYLRQGDEIGAAFCTGMADQAVRLGPVGEALYSHWASQMAERVERKAVGR